MGELSWVLAYLGGVVVCHLGLEPPGGEARPHQPRAGTTELGPRSDLVSFS